MLIKSRFSRVAVGLLSLLITSTVASYIAAEKFSASWVEKRLEVSAKRIKSSLQSANEEIENTLNSMQHLKLDGEDCSPEIYAEISNLVAANRFIYEAAMVLPSGAACSSYGHKIEDLSMLNGAQPYSSKNYKYWFSTRNLSGNTGFVVVSQGKGYVWLNSMIVTSALNIPGGVTFSLIDKNKLTPLFSSSERELDYIASYHAGQILTDHQGVHYTLPTQWDDILAVATLPLDAYQTTWLQVFSITLLGSLTIISITFWLTRKIRQRRKAWAPKLRRALKENQFSVHYQPIVNMRTELWVGMESLIRWSHSGHSISPAIFIPAAEKEGLIGEITRWVIQRVAEDYSKHLAACNGLYMTINLSAHEIEDESFPEFVHKTLHSFNVPANLIVFEVTESGLVNLDRATKQLNKLRAQGHRIAIDDFGTGYSSLSYIESLPIDILKIDRSFLTEEKMAIKDTLWRHIVSMADTLSLTVVAEGVEGKNQAEPLMQEGVKLAQGWLYSRDLPPSALKDAYLKMHQERPLTSA